MNNKLSILFLCILFLLSSCNLRQREQNLASQQEQLQEEKNELSLREQALDTRENEVSLRERKLDSNKLEVDSIALLYPKLPGKWNVNMVCSAATCPGSAIGDSKTEQWTISFMGNSILVKAYSNKILSRVYVGTINNGQLELTAQNPDATIDPLTQIKVYLRATGDSTSMEGKRNIIRTNCQIVYNLTMARQ